MSVECQVDRSQIKNREIAMRTLKARIYQQEVEAQISRTQAARKQQVSFTVIVLCLLIVYKTSCCLSITVFFDIDKARVNARVIYIKNHCY
jgi:hypothetical protein